MDGCTAILNLTVNDSSYTWGEAAAHRIHNYTNAASYLRPNNGGSLLPWVYTMIIIIVHLPTVIVRVIRWEIVQTWCIVSTLFDVVLCIQAYVSTEFDPAKILVWTPLILVIDASSMAQVFFLVIEAKKVKVGDRVILVEEEDGAHARPRSSNPSLAVDAPQHASYPLVRYGALWTPRAHQTESLLHVTQLRELLNKNDGAHGPPTPDSGRRNDEVALSWYRDPAAYTAASAAILFFAVLVLQIMGLAKSAVAPQTLSAPPMVSWCSPIFQPFGIAAVDSNCNVFDISMSDQRGIGCINLPGVWQSHWITGTMVGTIIELILEFVDVLILALVNQTRKFREVKMKRPWTTMLAGVVVLFVTLFNGVNYASTLPPGISSRVTVAMDAAGPSSYVGNLTTGGLRGTIIGWSDGMFESWTKTYFGQ